MIDLPLTSAQESLFLETLLDSHRIRIQVNVHDRNEKIIASLTAPASKLIGGSIQVDADADISRSLNLQLTDPTFSLTFDANSPAAGALYADRFVSVRYEVYVPTLDWVSVPVFMGPLTKFERQGATVGIEALGKESLALAPAYATKPYPIPKGTRVDNAIKKVMNRIGESSYDIPSLPQRLPSTRSVTPDSEPWKVIRGGEQDAKGRLIPGIITHTRSNYQVFYNGRGELSVRKVNKSSIFTFSESSIITQPVLSYDLGEFRNNVVVTGAKPKGGQRAIRASESLQASSPLSPTALGRNGKPRYMTEFIDAPNLKTKTQVRARARRVLNAKSTQGVEASFDALPIPHLEEGDLITVQTDEFTVDFPLKRFTLPLVPNSPMSIGTNRRVKVGKR